MNTDDYFRLLELIEEYADTTDRLPPEERLAQDLGISRVKLRDILSTLQSNGYVSRKKGIGTLINKYMLQEHARLDTDMVYEEMIEKSGQRPSSHVNKIKLVSDLPAEICEKLNLQKKDTAWQIEKITYADGVPAIFTVDYIPSQYYNDDEVDIETIAQCIFFFVQKHCDDLLDNLIVHVAAIAADEIIAERLSIKPHDPVLQLCSVCYSQKLTPIMYSLEYYNTDMLTLSFLKRLSRTKLQ